MGSGELSLAFAGCHFVLLVGVGVVGGLVVLVGVGLIGFLGLCRGGLGGGLLGWFGVVKDRGVLCGLVVVGRGGVLWL